MQYRKPFLECHIANPVAGLGPQVYFPRSYLGCAPAVVRYVQIQYSCSGKSSCVKIKMVKKAFVWMSCITQANLPQHEGFCKLSARVSSCQWSHIGELFRIDFSSYRHSWLQVSTEWTINGLFIIMDQLLLNLAGI